MTPSTQVDRLTYAPCPTIERFAAAVTALALLGIGGLAIRLGAPFLGGSGAVVPAVYAGSFVAMLVTATIAHNQFRASSYPPLAFLSNAFGITAFLLVAWIVVRPHVFTDAGFGLGSATAAWLWVVWHAGFTLLMGAYIVAEYVFTSRVFSIQFARRTAMLGGWASFILGCAVVESIFFFHASLPALGNPGAFTPFFHDFIEPVLLGAIAAITLALALATRVRQANNLWLCVVLVAFFVETGVSGRLPRGEFSVGWYVALAAGIAWQTLYLVVQLRHANEQLVAFAADKRSLIEVTLRDPLTRLLNRRGFDERFVDILTESRLANKATSILLFDIDHFKAFNDSFGHPAGDEALKMIADAVAHTVNRPTDACCRVGGEEFAIVLGETDASGAMTVAEKVRATVMGLRIAQATEIGKMLTVSIGTATVDAHAVVEPVELYERADKALYKAKRLGRNRISAYVQRESSLRIV